MESLFIGLDIGTSGCRAFIIDNDEQVVTSSSAPLPQSVFKSGHITQQAEDWWLCCKQVLTEALHNVDKTKVKALAVDGTSGSVLLTDSFGAVHGDAYMYNDSNNSEQAALISKHAPKQSGAHGCSSGLAKCLSLIKDHPKTETLICLNQADWIAGKFINRFNFSDENNTLKMGYDIIERCWPKWLSEVINPINLPQDVYEPGEVAGTIDSNIARQFGLPGNTKIIAGTTDSIAAFIATGASQPGDAVSSLGSTLAVKLISNKPVFAPEYGVYSHRLGNMWLAGGASNSGGAVLKDYFTQDQLDILSSSINPNQLTGLDYYPLQKPGERFPINNPELEPRLAPRAKNNVEFFQGMLEGIAKIEKQSYDKLAELGAGYPNRIITMGGGSKNNAWRIIREKFCNVTISNANISEAAYGSALLAKRSH